MRHPSLFSGYFECLPSCQPQDAGCLSGCRAGRLTGSCKQDQTGQMSARAAFSLSSRRVVSHVASTGPRETAASLNFTQTITTATSSSYSNQTDVSRPARRLISHKLDTFGCSKVQVVLVAGGVVTTTTTNNNNTAGRIQLDFPLASSATFKMDDIIRLDRN